MNDREIELCNIYISDYYYMIKDDRIAVLDFFQKFAGLDLG